MTIQFEITDYEKRFLNILTQHITIKDSLGKPLGEEILSSNVELFYNWSSQIEHKLGYLLFDSTAQIQILLLAIEYYLKSKEKNIPDVLKKTPAELYHKLEEKMTDETKKRFAA